MFVISILYFMFIVLLLEHVYFEKNMNTNKVFLKICIFFILNHLFHLINLYITRFYKVYLAQSKYPLGNCISYCIFYFIFAIDAG
jgi:hypothetical protein